MKKIHIVEGLSFTEDALLINIDGKSYQFHLADVSEKLLSASQYERERYEISPSGYGIHWVLLDEDLSVDALVGIRHSPSFNRERIAV